MIQFKFFINPTIKYWSESGARFGSTLAAIGDIDGDSKGDFAVAAPYEDDGKGAVYVYYGDENFEFSGNLESWRK